MKSGLVIELDTLSDGALAAVMNALNPSPNDFTCEGDLKAFNDTSLLVARRWWEQKTGEEL